MLVTILIRSKLHSYDDVVEKLANQISLDDLSKIRLIGHIWCSRQQEGPTKYISISGGPWSTLINYNHVFLFFFLDIYKYMDIHTDIAEYCGA